MIRFSAERQAMNISTATWSSSGINGPCDSPCIEVTLVPLSYLFRPGSAENTPGKATPMNDTEVWSAIDDQRRRTADLLEQLSEEEWRHASLCPGWTVRMWPPT